MLKPRWKKVLRDLWSDKSRTALVVLSIFIGVFATGVINGARAIVIDELQRSYDKTKPAHITVRLSDADSFDDSLLRSVEKIDGVAAVEGRRSTSVSIQIAPDQWEDFDLTAIADFDDIQVHKLRFVEGATEPRDKDVLLERSSMQELNASIGDTIIIERTDGKQKYMQITGVVHDLSKRPTSMNGTYYGYVTPETMLWLGKSSDYTQMLIRVSANAPMPERAAGGFGQPGSGPGGGRGGGGGPGGGMGRQPTQATSAKPNEPTMMQILHITSEVEDKIEKSGREPRVPRRGPPGMQDPTEHWATSFITTLAQMMGVLGIMALFLSGFLVTNTISALLAQQVRQIGIMKSIGARNSHIMGMYMVLVLCFGVLSMLVAIPLTVAITKVFVSLIASYYNFDLSAAVFPSRILLMQAFASLIIPVVASIVPVLTGTRVTVLQALNSEGIQATAKKKKPKKNQQATNTKQPKVRTGILPLHKILNRPLLLSVRNTFRRKARVTLTLLTLTIGGLIFIGIFTIRDSLLFTLNDLLEKEIKFDAAIMLDDAYRDYHVVETIAQAPDVATVESWAMGSAARVYANGSESEHISITALPPDSQMMEPVIIEGRWLLPEDAHAIVVNIAVLEDDTDIDVGSSIVLNINEEESTWQVVGIMTSLSDSREAYVPFIYYTRVTGEVNQTRSVRVLFEDTTDIAHATLVEAIENQLQQQNIGVSRTFSKTYLMDLLMERFNFIIIALIVMALLMAIVGGLGLAGTMSLNVIERTREIGIMRAIGASNAIILQIFLGEGLLIGILSWFFGTSLSVPVSKLLSDALGGLFFRQPLTFNFSFGGVGIWLGLSMLLAILASFFPAWNATRVSVREVLAHE